jgi:hypothetical protein
MEPAMTEPAETSPHPTASAPEASVRSAPGRNKADQRLRIFDTPNGLIQLQLARLAEAMILARTMMRAGDLNAMDRLIKLVGELDRYHGYRPAQIVAGPEGRSRWRRASTRSVAESSREAGGKFSGSEPLEIPQNQIGISKLTSPARHSDAAFFGTGPVLKCREKNLVG